MDLPRHIPEAACSVVPINCVLGVKLDRLREIAQSVFMMLQTIPNETPSIIGWRIVLFHLDHLVEVL